MILTDDEVLAIAKSEGQKLALGKNPNIDIDFARAIEAAVLKKLKQHEPVAWMMHNKAYGLVPSLHFAPKTDWHITREAIPLYAAMMPDDSLHLYENLADEYGLSVFEDIAALKKQRDEFLAAAEAVEIDAEECMDFDDCAGMFIPIDSYHKLMEAIASVKGETK